MQFPVKSIKDEKIVPKNIIAFGLNPATKKPSLKKENFDFKSLDLTFRLDTLEV